MFFTSETKKVKLRLSDIQMVLVNKSELQENNVALEGSTVLFGKFYTSFFRKSEKNANFKYESKGKHTIIYYKQCCLEIVNNISINCSSHILAITIFVTIAYFYVIYLGMKPIIFR